MTVTANQALQLRNTNGRARYSRTVKTGQVIYKHTYVFFAVTDGLAYSGEKWTATTMRFAGVATTGPITGNGTRTIELFDQVEILATLKTSVTKGHSGDAMHVFDNFALTQLTTHGPQCGVLREFVAANSGWVMLRAAAMADGT